MDDYEKFQLRHTLVCLWFEYLVIQLFTAKLEHNIQPDSIG